MRIIALCVLLTSPLVALAAQNGEPTGFRELAAQFRAAHDSGHVGKISQVVCWDRVDARTRAAVERHIASEFGRPISSISFDPLPQDADLEYEQAGVTYRPNLTPLGYLVVRYASDPAQPTAATAARFLLGRKSGELRITTAAPVPDR
jgi:hypothetical protein